MSNKKVTIIIPVYNVEKYLSRCLNNVINQTYSNIEIILVNDGATDNSQEICEEYKRKDNRIKLLLKENGGLSDARNYGIPYATGDYIAFIDSDDMIHTSYIEYLLDLVEKYDGDISICGYKSFYNSDDNIVVNDKKDSIEIFNSNDALEQLLYNKKIQCSAWGKLYKKELLKEIRYPVGKLFEDIGTTYKLFYKAKNIILGKKRLYYYFIRNDSISHMSFNSRNMDSLVLSMEMCEFIEKKCNVNKNAIKYRKIIASFTIIKKIVRADGKFEKELAISEKILKEAIKGLTINSNMNKKEIILILISKLNISFLKKIFNIFKWL